MLPERGDHGHHAVTNARPRTLLDNINRSHL